MNSAEKGDFVTPSQWRAHILDLEYLKDGRRQSIATYFYTEFFAFMKSPCECFSCCLEAVPTQDYARAR